MQKTGLMLSLIMLLSVLNACEKEVHIKLTSKDKLIVIEGNIETNQQPYVYNFIDDTYECVRNPRSSF